MDTRTCIENCLKCIEACEKCAASLPLPCITRTSIWYHPSCFFSLKGGNHII